MQEPHGDFLHYVQAEILNKKQKWRKTLNLKLPFENDEIFYRLLKMKNN